MTKCKLQRSSEFLQVIKVHSDYMNIILRLKGIVREKSVLEVSGISLVSGVLSQTANPHCSFSAVLDNSTNP